MKNIVIYSPDFSLCYSLLMYLQTQYKVVATTDLDVVSSLVCSNSADLVILDTEPNTEILLMCENFKKCKGDLIFEMQIMPQLFNYFHELAQIDWGTIIIYTYLFR